MKLFFMILSGILLVGAVANAQVELNEKAKKALMPISIEEGGAELLSHLAKIEAKKRQKQNVAHQITNAENQVRVIQVEMTTESEGVTNYTSQFNFSNATSYEEESEENQGIQQEKLDAVEMLKTEIKRNKQ